MKTIYTVFVFIIAVACCSTLVAGNKTIVGGKLQIMRATEAPVIDGVLDPVWESVTAVPMTLVEGHSVDTVCVLHDHASWFRAMWDDGYFYAFVNVVDDSIDASEKSSPWMSDCVELFFDGDNSKGTSYDGVNDVQWRYLYGETYGGVGNGGNGLGEYAWSLTPTGYTFEVRIAGDSLYGGNFLTADQEIGFEVSNADRDGGVGQESVIHWWTNNGLTWNNPSLFGTANLTVREANSVMNIPYAETPVTVDGVMSEGEWDAANEISLVKVEGGRPIDSIYTSWKKHAASCWTMWDNSYFYAFVSVVDDSLDASEKSSPWSSDCVELFFDGDNSKGTSYDGVNDVQWRYLYGETPGGVGNGGNGQGEYTFVNTALGYDFELRISADSLYGGNFLVNDRNIGFEVSNADRRGGVGQVSVLHWWTSNGLTWNDASLFGTALLTGGSVGVNEEPSVISGFNLEQNYPNPFNPSTEIAFTLAKSSYVKLAVYNILGKKVADLFNGRKDIGYHTVSFDAKNLSSGVYFYTLETETAVQTKKMMLLK